MVLDNELLEKFLQSILKEKKVSVERQVPFFRKNAEGHAAATCVKYDIINRSNYAFGPKDIVIGLEILINHNLVKIKINL